MAIRKAFDAKDAELEMLGNRPAEWSIEYSISEEKVLNKSAGSRKPTSYSVGDESYECTLMLGMADQVAMEAAAKKAGYANVLKIPPFPIVISYINPDQQLVQDVVIASFQSTGRKVGESDTLRFEHAMFTVDIELNKSL